MSVYTSLEAASKYCTLPRSGDLTAGGVRRRPVSTSGYPTTNTMRNTLLRRGSVQGHKPPPPIRRTSSITSSFRQHLPPVGGSMEHLPPPPAFLLDGEGKGGSVADTVLKLTELRHQPASPGAVRRNNGVRSQSAERRGTGDGLIATLSAKIAPSLSPRNSRRHSEDLNNRQSPCGNRLLQRGIVGPGQNFLQALNTKLAQQQQVGGQPKANRIRQFIGSRTIADPSICHESLMDQIKRGTHLRRTGTVNDRSAPKIR